MARGLQQWEMVSQPAGATVHLQGVTREFAGQAILSRVDLTIGPGEIVALVGKSGVGKSTLLRLVAGLEAPSSGRIEIDGQPVTGPHPQVRVMFQDARLLPWKTVLHNVLFGLVAPDGLSRALEALEAVGLADKAHAWPATLSGGQKQRVALARALVHRPRVLLLDEPLGALDALTRRDMQQLIEDMWLQHGFTAVLVTHDVEEALALAHRVVLLAEGTVAMDLRVPFGRPRPRESHAFVRLRETILDRLLGRWPDKERLRESSTTTQPSASLTNVIS